MALRTIPYKQELFWFSWMQIPLYFFGTPHSFLALVYYHQWWQFISGDKYLSWTEWKNERNHFHFHFWRDTKMAEEYHQHPLWFTWLYYIPDGTASATIMVQNRDSWRCHYWAFMLILFTIKVNAKKTKKCSEKDKRPPSIFPVVNKVNNNEFWIKLRIKTFHQVFQIFIS